MKLLCFSDIHLDNHIDEGKSFLSEMATGDFDAVSIAGDIGHYKALGPFLKNISEAFKGKPVLFVLGNHDTWGGSVAKAIYKAESVARTTTNLFLLENRVRIIDGVKFAGTTLWYPFDSSDPKSVMMAIRWPDFFNCEGFSEEVSHRNKKAVQFLERNVDENTVVITHHMPSYACVNEKYKNDKTNCFYVGGAAHVLMGNNAKLWHCGHTHTAFDFIEANTRVVCNPLGYPMETGTNFRRDFVVEV